jgi:hypothetical protein
MEAFDVPPVCGEIQGIRHWPQALLRATGSIFRAAVM